MAFRTKGIFSPWSKMNKFLPFLLAALLCLAGCEPASKPDAVSSDPGSEAATPAPPEEPDWMPHPARSQRYSEEEIAFLRACAENEHMEFDPQRKLLIGGGGNDKKGLIRWSIGYATVLMDSGEEEHRQRALDILETALPTQHNQPGDRYHGNWPKFLEEPIVPNKRFDGNQADFIAMALLDILARHEQRLPEEMKEQIRERLLLAADYIQSRTIPATYTNAYFMGILNLLAIGERYDRPELVEAGLEHLRKIHELAMDQGSYTEYQSPNYTSLVLDILYRLLSWVEHPEARAMGAELYEETWRQIASQYHPPSQQWAGPQLRNRGGEEILSDGKAWMIRRAVDGSYGIPPESVQPSRKTANLVRIPHRLPGDMRKYFNDLPEPRQVVQSYFSLTPVSLKFLPDDYTNRHDFIRETIGTTFLHPQFALGTVNRGHFAPDRRGIMAHWGTPEQAGAMIIQFYKDGIPFCAPQHFGIQDRNRALYAINLSTNGGDTHWFFDRINGTIEPRDLRIRIEFLGIGKDAKLFILDKEQRIAEVRSGELTFRIAVPVALFNGNAVELRIGAPQPDRRTLDLVLHKGGQQRFDLRKFDDTAIGIALAIDTDGETTSFESLKSSLKDHCLSLDWDGLSLSIPTVPDTDVALQKSFEVSAHNSSRK
jgi:hypothetical protein